MYFFYPFSSLMPNKTKKRQSQYLTQILIKSSNLSISVKQSVFLHRINFNLSSLDVSYTIKFPKASTFLSLWTNLSFFNKRARGSWRTIFVFSDTEEIWGQQCLETKQPASQHYCPLPQVFAWIAMPNDCLWEKEVATTYSKYKKKSCFLFSVWGRYVYIFYWFLNFKIFYYHLCMMH